ncbi:Uncharacterised protein [Neisseria animaloris]|uniref:hypothetical protein n=1 Tax=Neisseria animaloris TaxID=326522 RepID=UPI000A255AFD|nr:hypothetical protein [Neisseria animaloris]OSI07079.1 hypothetical protein BWD08_09420 [Neisseria animaloris]VEH88187.1 Uncharacterised protein [Neisseria animaloris]
MTQKSSWLLCTLLIGGISLPALAEHPGVPKIPTSRSPTTPAMMIHAARVRPQETKTDGYHVTDSTGRSFYIDNIVKPRCAFYANHVDTTNVPGYKANKIKIISKAYIGKVDIKGCH